VGKGARAAELETLTVAGNFWQDQEKAQTILKERSGLVATINQWKKHQRGLDDATVFMEMAEAGDAEAATEVDQQVVQLEKEVSQAELERMLGGEHDAGNVVHRLTSSLGLGAAP